MNIKQYIEEIPDFPKKGILFYDLSPLLASKEAWRFTIDSLANIIKPMKPDIIAGIESRGFLVSAALATYMDMGSLMIRKPGKLPGKTLSCKYDLEYGSNCLEIKKGLIKKGLKVVIVDDVLATGGTISASKKLIEEAGGKVVGCAFIIELLALHGNEKIKGVPFSSLITY